MNRRTWITSCVGILTLWLLADVLVVADLAVEWYTVDGGGVAQSTGGDFELSGTIGQPDAGLMSGGSYTLSGGFWAVPPCWCLADLNQDGFRDGRDVQAFLDCYWSLNPGCGCADVEPDGELDSADVAAFVDSLLDGGGCP
jgi:hypothetical protein